MAIETQAQYDTVKRAVEAEMAKPALSRNVDFLRKAVTELRAAEMRFGAQVDPQAAAVAEGLQGSVFEQEAQQAASSQAVQEGALSAIDIPQGGLPAQARSMAQGVNERLLSLQDALRRAVLGDTEQSELQSRRAEQFARQRLEIEEQGRREGARPGALETDRTAGGLVPDVVAGFGPGAAIRGVRAGSALGRVVAETGLSALSAIADTPLTGDPTTNLMFAVPFGAGVGLLAELPGFARNIVLSDALRAARNPETRRNRELAASAGIDLSLAEASLDDRVRSMEQAIPNVPGNPRTEFSRRRQGQIVRMFAEIDEALNPEQLSSDQIINATRDAYDKHVRELGRIASANFVNTLRPVVEELGASIDDQGRIIGGRRVISVRNLLEEYETQLRLGIEAPRTISPSQEAELRRAISELREANDQGGMTLGKAQTYLRELTEASYPTGNTLIKQRQNAVDVLDAKALRRALLDDLDATDTGPGRRAAEALKAAREQYAADMAVMDSLQGQAIDRLLGKVGGRVDSEDFVRNVMALPTRQFNELMTLLDRTKPGLANAVRSRVFAELADKHRRLAAGGGRVTDTVEFDAAGFLADINKMPFSRRQALTGLDATQTEQVWNGLKVLQIIADGPEGVAITRSALQYFENVAINAASRNPGFVSRLLAGRLGPAFFERVLFTPEGLKSLETLGSRGATRTATAQAVSRLGQIALDLDAQKEELIRREQERARTAPFGLAQ